MWSVCDCPVIQILPNPQRVVASRPAAHAGLAQCAIPFLRRGSSPQPHTTLPAIFQLPNLPPCHRNFGQPNDRVHLSSAGASYCDPNALLAGDHIDHHQDAEPPTVDQRVRNKVQRRALVVPAAVSLALVCSRRACGHHDVAPAAVPRHTAVAASCVSCGSPPRSSSSFKRRQPKSPALGGEFLQPLRRRRLIQTMQQLRRRPRHSQPSGPVGCQLAVTPLRAVAIAFATASAC
jgi:hypothetical protein